MLGLAGLGLKLELLGTRSGSAMGWDALYEGADESGRGPRSISLMIVVSHCLLRKGDRLLGLKVGLDQSIGDDCLGDADGACCLTLELGRRVMVLTLSAEVV